MFIVEMKNILILICYIIGKKVKFHRLKPFKDVLLQYANVSVFYTILTFYILSEHKNCELNRYARIAFIRFFHVHQDSKRIETVSFVVTRIPGFLLSTYFSMQPQQFLIGDKNG